MKNHGASVWAVMGATPMIGLDRAIFYIVHNALPEFIPKYGKKTN
jgi:hypothetical protein